MKNMNNQSKHHDGFYNMKEMVERSGKTRLALYLKVSKNCPFRFGYIGSRIYAVKESFDKWVSEGCPNIAWRNFNAANEVRLVDAPTRYRACKHYYKKCECKVKGKVRKMVCPLNCEHYEYRYVDAHPTYESEFDLPNNADAVRRHVAYLQFKSETE